MPDSDALKRRIAWALQQGQLIRKTRGLGPDDPINWNEFGSEEPIQALPMARQESPFGISKAGAAQSQPMDRGGSWLDGLISKLIMLGWNPEKEFSQRQQPNK